MKVQQQISRKKKAELIGRSCDIVLEGPSEETDLLWEGRTEMHAPEIDGKIFINDFGDYDEFESARAASSAARSPKPTTTTWLRD